MLGTEKQSCTESLAFPEPTPPNPGSLPAKSPRHWIVKYTEPNRQA